MGKISVIKLRNLAVAAVQVQVQGMHAGRSFPAMLQRALRKGSHLHVHPQHHLPTQFHRGAAAHICITDPVMRLLQQGCGQQAGRYAAPLPTGRAGLVSCPKCCPLCLSLAQNSIVAVPVSSRGFPIGLLGWPRQIGGLLTDFLVYDPLRLLALAGDGSADIVDLLQSDSCPVPSSF